VIGVIVLSSLLLIFRWMSVSGSEDASVTRSPPGSDVRSLSSSASLVERLSPEATRLVEYCLEKAELERHQLLQQLRVAEGALVKCPSTDRDLLAKLNQLTTENIRLTAENEYLSKQLRSVPSIGGEALPLSLPNEAEHTIRAVPLHRTTADASAADATKLPTNTARITTKKIGVVVLCHNRPEYLKRALDSVLTYKPDHIPLFVSQDSDRDKTLWSMVNSPPYKDRLTAFQITERDIPAKRVSAASYYYIANHYKKALDKIFSETDLDSLIILEEDIEIAPDFFDYFETTQRLLDEDPSLLCVSAWNDLGQEKFVRDPYALRRSNFFPGLGWLLTRRLWDELSPKWPTGFWDDWIREPEQRKGRDCIHPEISRTYTFGSSGASGGQFFKEHLSLIKLNDKAVPWREMDLSYLFKDKWDEQFNKLLDGIEEVSANDASAALEQKRNSKIGIRYSNKNEYRRLGHTFGFHSDMKAGVPRTAYRGVVHFWAQNDNQLFFLPASDYR